MAKRHAHTEDAEINITPMLDIVFIMLIFFIVTTSFTKETGAAIVKPQAEQAISLRNGTILIVSRRKVFFLVVVEVNQGSLPGRTVNLFDGSGKDPGVIPPERLILARF